MKSKRTIKDEYKGVRTNQPKLPKDIEELVDEWNTGEDLAYYKERYKRP